MNPFKRQLNIGGFYNEETKKLRISERITSIEDLSNELFYEISDYLDGCDLYNAFSNLNERFQDLLSCSSFRLKINPSRLSNFRDCHQNIILPNRHKIISLCLVRRSAIDFFFQSVIFDSSFDRLESITLCEVRSNVVKQILTKLLSLSHLYFLTLTIRDYDLKDLNDVYQRIFNLRALKYNKLCFGEDTLLIPLRITNSHFSNIKYLNLDHECILNDLVHILYYTPYLSRIVCKRLIQSNQSIEKATISLPFLTYISIGSWHLEFDVLEIFIKKISSQLKILCVFTSDYEAYLDADRWERLISQHIPHLRNFYFECCKIINDNFQVTQNDARINRFTSSFWLERRWIFAIKINVNYFFLTEAIYSIRPYRKKWYELNEFPENDEHSNQNTELAIFEPSFADYNEPLIDNIAPCFNIIQITKLDVLFEATFVGMLLDLLRHLPELDSLRVWSLSLIKPRCLYPDEETIFRLVSTNNEIKKVNIQQMTDIDQVQCLINLCPYMQYFEIGCSNDTDFKLLVQFILIKNRRHISHLRVLCLCIQIADDKMIEELRNMIKLKKVRHEYHIKRKDNKIYLQRK